MPPGRFLRGATGSSSRPGHVAGVGLHARPRELGTQARPTDSLGRCGAEKEMKDGERETSKPGERRADEASGKLPQYHGFGCFKAGMSHQLVA